MKESLVDRFIGWSGFAGGLALTALAYHSFSPPAALLLGVLWGVAAIRPVYAVAIFFVAVSDDWTRPVSGIFIDLSELELAVLVLGCLVAWRGSWRRLDWKPLLWGSPYAAAVLLSGLVQNEWYRVLPHALRLSEMMVALWLARCAALDRSRQPYAVALALGALLYGVGGVGEFGEVVLGRAVSFFANANQFAAYVNLLAPVTVAFWARGSGYRSTWAGLSMLTLLCSAATGSRAAMAALGAALVVVGGLADLSFTSAFLRHPLEESTRILRRHRRRLAWGGMAVVLAASLLAWRFPVTDWLQEMRTRSEGGVLEVYLDQRWPIAVVASQIWSDHPWMGVGPGNYTREVEARRELVESYQDRLRNYSSFQQSVTIHPHNLYLQLGVETGLFGLTAFLFFLLRVSRAMLQGSKTSAWCLGGAGVLTAFWIHNLFDCTFPSLGIETGLMLGFTLDVPEAASLAKGPKVSPVDNLSNDS